MKNRLRFIFLLFPVVMTAQMTFVKDSILNEAVSFATISFGDGRGTFAGVDGEFYFSKDKYEDIDSLFISAIGYRDVGFSTKKLPQEIILAPEASLLAEVILTAEKRGKFKKLKFKPTTHTDYFSCWLPTVESEVAVFFQRQEGKSSKIAKLLIPINAEEEYRKKGNMKFSTLFRIQFYSNEDGFPGKPIKYGDIVFNVTEEHDEIYELDLEKYNVFIPETGIYASLQVLGYADPTGKLIQTKKYNEIKTRRGITKVSTTFRPLLPFTGELVGQKTFVRRVFFNAKKWQVFDRTYNANSKLIQSGNNNYGMGALMHVYQD